MADLVQSVLSVPEAEAVCKKRRHFPDFNSFDFEDGVMRWSVKIVTNDVGVEPNDTVIVLARPDKSPAHYDLLKLSGDRIGTIRRSAGDLPPWWNDLLSVHAKVEEVEPQDTGRVRISLSARELAT